MSKLYYITFWLFIRLLICFCSTSISALAQQTTYVVSGTVIDARSGEGIPFASVALVGRNTGVTSDENGLFTLRTSRLTDSLYVSSMGFGVKRFGIDKNKLIQQVVLRVPPAGKVLQEVIVRAGENPAWGILRNVRKNLEKNDRSRIRAYEYDSYAKTSISLTHISDKLRSNPLIKKVLQVMATKDSVVDDLGRKIMPLMMTESVSKYYYRESPERRHEEILKTRLKGMDIVEPEIISQFVGGNALSYNFYQNYIRVLGKDFASPVGADWKGWYAMYLADTTRIGDFVCYEIQFDPKNKQDLLFTGKMWIDTTTFALTMIEAKVGAEANLNYVRRMELEQELEPALDSAGAMIGWMPVAMRTTVELYGVGKNSIGALAQQVTRNGGFILNKPKPLSFYDRPVSVADTAKTNAIPLEELEGESKEDAIAEELYWAAIRKNLGAADSLSVADRKVQGMIDTLRAVPLVRTTEVLTRIATTGWYRHGPIDWGPYPYAIAVNNIEGLRLRAGFRTNGTFSKTMVIRAYAAYGTADARFKGGFEYDYILSRRKWTIIGARIAYDLERLGFTPELINGNKVFYAFSRFGQYRGGYYSSNGELFVRTEPLKGVMLTAAIGDRTFMPTFPFHYRTQPDLDHNSPTRPDFNDSYWSVEARLSRKETYIMDGNERIPVSTKRTPVIWLKYTHGHHAFGGSFTYNRYSFRAFQTLKLGKIGRSSYVVQAGFTPSRLPAPLLFTHTGNPTIFFAPNTFNRMQFYEFVSDRFVAVHWQHNFEGILFNRLPLIKKLNWRLWANADVLWGSRQAPNRRVDAPEDVKPGLRPTVFGSLDPNIPYIEAGYGISNIFKLLRIQVVHRLNYLGPRTDRFAIKGGIEFSF
ncbi:DUF5686 and carboxypeptidase-like regulatory domain-containing protein [Fibrella aquatica]|uniref:DUF5686 and carboxypeptidase-like regulatory domain-containing protein n=1 Tax=Fibrella aquatica TaxID=3242487 RepID=UPI0035223A83